MSRSLVYLGAFGLFSLACAGAACTAEPRRSTFGDGGADGTGGSTSGGIGGASTSSGLGGGFNPTGGGGNGSGSCNTDPAVDDDKDGFTENDGDCNDCDANVNPGAIEVMTPAAGAGGAGGAPQPADEDCDGKVDNVAAPCDGALALDSGDAMDGARAIELCKTATAGGKDWGVLSATYVRADGSAAAPSAQYGIQNQFGSNVPPKRGTQMLLLSTGHARTPGQPDECGTHACSGYGPGTAPPGYPQNAPGCDQGTSINDDIGLELKLRAPKNATGYKYLFKFYSFEFAEYVCTLFNDQYIALVNPPPVGSNNGNISFDNNMNPVSVNIAFFDVCDAASNNDFAMWCLNGCPAQPNPYCPLGAGELVGTGFEPTWGEDAGGTTWLQSTAPITGGDEFTIRYAIWDTEDDIYDSAVLLDGFQWIANGGTVTVSTTEPPPN